VPGFNGKYALSIVVTKLAESIFGEYVPWIGARLDADPCAAVVVVVDCDCLLDEPQPAVRPATSATAMARLRFIRPDGTQAAGPARRLRC